MLGLHPVPDDVAWVNVLDVCILEHCLHFTLQEGADVFQYGIATGICGTILGLIFQQVLHHGKAD